MTKYNNKKTVIDNMVFDSKKEANRYLELKLLLKAKQISDLKRQITYVLVPKQGGERAVKYIADFVYTENGKTVVEDVKGFRTDVYKIKRKLFKQIYSQCEFRET